MTEKRGNGEGTKVLVHKSGGYYRQIMLGGKRVTKYGKTPAEVNRKIREAIRRYEDGQELTDSRAKVAAWAVTWETVKLPASGLRRSAQDAYLTIIKKWVVPAIGDKRVSEVRESDCEGVLLAMQAAGRADSYRRLAHSAMTSLFRAAVRERLITVSPMPAHRPSAGKSKAVALSPEQFQALMGALAGKPTLRHVVPFLALTGLRRGEALGVRWEDIDEAEGVIRLTKQVTRDSEGLTLRPMKTDGSEREIELTAPLREVLRERRKVQMRDRMKAPVGTWADDQGLVFTTRLGTMFEPNNINRAFRGAVREAGLPTSGKGKITPHSLRHSVATLLLNAGVDEKVVAEVMGHSSPRITREVYQHVVRKQRADALGKVGEALGWQ